MQGIFGRAPLESKPLTGQEKTTSSLKEFGDLRFRRCFDNSVYCL